MCVTKKDEKFYSFSIFLHVSTGNVSIGVAKPYPVSEDYDEEAGSDVTQVHPVAASLQAQPVDSETTNNLTRQGKGECLALRKNGIHGWKTW